MGSSMTFVVRTPHSCALKWARSLRRRPTRVRPTSPRRSRPLRCKPRASRRLSPVRAGITFRRRQSPPTVPTSTSSIRLITSSKVNLTSWHARRRVRWPITLAARITRCSYMAAPVWVKPTCCTPSATALWRVSQMLKWSICTPSVSCRTW